MKPYTNNFFIFLCLLSFAACKSKKIPAKIGHDQETQSLQLTKYGRMEALLNKNTPSFEYLTFKMHSNFDDGEQKLSFTSKVRIKKDSIIWISTDIMGFEVARIRIKTDSIIILNRTQSKVMYSSFDHLSKKMGFPVQFSSMQNSMLGKIPVELSPDHAFEIIADSANTSIISLLQTKNNANDTLTHLYQYLFNISNTQGLLNYWKINGVQKNISNEVINDKFVVVNALQSFYVPTEQQINVHIDKMIKIKNELNKIDTSACEFPFNIPLKYEKETF